MNSLYHSYNKAQKIKYILKKLQTNDIYYLKLNLDKLLKELNKLKYNKFDTTRLQNVAIVHEEFFIIYTTYKNGYEIIDKVFECDFLFDCPKKLFNNSSIYEIFVNINATKNNIIKICENKKYHLLDLMIEGMHDRKINTDEIFFEILTQNNLFVKLKYESKYLLINSFNTDFNTLLKYITNETLFSDSHLIMLVYLKILELDIHNYELILNMLIIFYSSKNIKNRNIEIEQKIINHINVNNIHCASPIWCNFQNEDVIEYIIQCLVPSNNEPLNLFAEKNNKILFRISQNINLYENENNLYLLNFVFEKYAIIANILCVDLAKIIILIMMNKEYNKMRNEKFNKFCECIIWESQTSNIYSETEESSSVSF